MKTEEAGRVQINEIRITQYPDLVSLKIESMKDESITKERDIALTLTQTLINAAGAEFGVVGFEPSTIKPNHSIYQVVRKIIGGLNVSFSNISKPNH